MGLVVGGRGPDGIAVLEPLDGGLGAALGLAVEGDGFVLRHDYVGGVLGDPGRAVLP